MREAIGRDGNEDGEIRKRFTIRIARELTLKRVIFGLGGLASLALVMPIAVLAAKAGLTLLAAGGSALLGYFAFRQFPVWVSRMEHAVIERNRAEMNRHLLALKAAARKNPIETLQNELAVLEKQKDGISHANSQFQSAALAYAAELGESEKEDPSVDYAEENSTVLEMKNVCIENDRLLHEFTQGIAFFRKKANEASRKWNLAIKANSAFDLLDDREKADHMRDILSQVCFDEVRAQYHTIFARMNSRAIELSANRSFKIGGKVVEFSTIKIPEVDSGRRGP